MAMFIAMLVELVATTHLLTLSPVILSRQSLLPPTRRLWMFGDCCEILLRVRRILHRQREELRERTL